jgi:F-type H+-transporting ATPase subunit gamma
MYLQMILLIPALYTPCAPVSAVSYDPRTQQLLPVDIQWLQALRDEPWPTQVIPMTFMDWKDLFAALIRQFFFVALYRALAESLASESASRLSSMEAAEQSIEDRLEELQAEHRRLRQSTVTEELLDVIAGFEALSGGGFGSLSEKD